MNRVLLKALLMAGGLMLAACGYSSRGPEIDGQVLLDGQPLAGAQLTFEPLDQSGKLGGAIAHTNETGTFELEPHPATGETLKAGTYAVSVSRKVDLQGNLPASGDFGQMQAAGQLRETVPLKYMFQPGMPPAISAQIKEGRNELKFELLSR